MDSDTLTNRSIHRGSTHRNCCRRVRCEAGEEIIRTRGRSVGGLILPLRDMCVMHHVDTARPQPQFTSRLSEVRHTDVACTHRT